MTANRKTAGVLEDAQVNVKIKLAGFWGTLLLIYIYVDIFGFYKPGTIQNILAGKVWEFEISQAWALGALLLMVVPSIMVLLSMILKAGVNRWINIVVAVFYIVVGIGTTIGETWAFYIVGHVVGIVLLLIIIWTAVRWPKKQA
jgi:hypothetical protein